MPHTVSTTPVPATGPGALSAYANRCTCGDETRYSLPRMAAVEADRHLAWHARAGR